MSTASRSRSRTRKAAPSSARVVHVGLTQMACGPDPAANLARQLRLAARAAANGAQIICTQELFKSPYFCQTEDHRFFALAESIPGPCSTSTAAPTSG
jgi:N-carbamoylputrescine amidase